VGGRALVWTLPADEAARVLALDDDGFARGITTAFDARLGGIRPTTRRLAFPLQRQLSATQHLQRVLVVGDAAHAVHPLAGQGVNLGLRDVSALRDSILEAQRRRLSWEAPHRLARWARVRRSENAVAAHAFEGINRLFSNDAVAATLVRGHLLGLAGRVPPLVDLFWRRAAGG
jgi:2-octaprenyl-3-methyl-6-methoxy-1,4-benzoquinol hydroxylase